MADQIVELIRLLTIVTLRIIEIRRIAHPWVQSGYLLVMPSHWAYSLEIKPVRKLDHRRRPSKAEASHGARRRQHKVRIRSHKVQILRCGINLIVMASSRKF